MSVRRRTKVLLWTLLAIVVAGVAGVVALLTVPPPVERWLQTRVLLGLREHYQSDVRLENLHVTLIPCFYATADNFVLPNRFDAQLPPLITVKHLTAKASFFQLLRTPVHLSWLKVDGLVIQVAHKRDGGSAASKPKHHSHLANFDIETVDADGTQLYILRKDPAREPMQFDLRRLTLHSAGVGQPMTFTADLTNPTPPGVIETNGRFGPWNFDEPSATRVDGHYIFQHADLSVFNGISGILSSTGDYYGILQNIVVDGATDTPDFKVDRGGQAVHLTTQFHAIVDGTNGNTYLQPVNAHFLNSDVVTNGEIASQPGQKGKTINLDVDIQHAQVQDVLALASKSERAALTGPLALKAKLNLPPGADPVLHRMQLGGRFAVWDARFTNDKLRRVFVEISRRGQGKPGDQSIQDVRAQFNGDFEVRKSTLTFSKLQFAVPGAMAQVKGWYSLRSQQLDFTGGVRMNARISQMLSGTKRWLLVPFDPLFMKHGAGTYLPVYIKGTREHPEVGLQWKKILSGFRVNDGTADPLRIRSGQALGFARDDTKTRRVG
jgi:hypothetical protein